MPASISAQPTVVNAAQLETAGLSIRALFTEQKVAFRRVDRVVGDRVELGDERGAVRLAQSLLPRVEPGLWLRFTLRPGRRVEVAVDAEATLRGETRLATLFAALSRPRPLH